MSYIHINNDFVKTESICRVSQIGTKSLNPKMPFWFIVYLEDGHNYTFCRATIKEATDLQQSFVSLMGQNLYKEFKTYK